MTRYLLILTALLTLVACGNGNTKNPLDNEPVTDDAAVSDDLPDDILAADDDAIILPSWKKISAGGMHTCGIRTADDKLYCWGGNNYGQLGNGTADGVLTPTKIGDDTWSEILAGEGWNGSHTCGIKASDSGLYCWGYNNYGQLGDGTAGAGTDKNTPTKIGTATWVALATGLYHTCGIQTDNKLYCWGYNFDGQVGDGTSGAGADKNTPTKVGDDEWSVITAGWNHTCGIKASDGTLYCWGYNESAQLGDGSHSIKAVPTKIGDAAWSAITAGDKHTCGIQADKKIYCWGDNGWGALGDGTGTDKLVPTMISDDTWSDISAGLFHTCGIQASDKTLYCWGQNLSEQLGDGTMEDKTSPTKIGVATDTWSAITAGALHTCGIKASDNTLYCWGDNDFGKLGDGTATVRDEMGQLIENKGKNTPTPVIEP